MKTKKIGLFEAKTRLSELVRSAGRGHTYIITCRGSEMAELRPVTKPKRALEPDCARNAGYWMAPDFTAPLEDLKEYMR